MLYKKCRVAALSFCTGIITGHLGNFKILFSVSHPDGAAEYAWNYDEASQAFAFSAQLIPEPDSEQPLQTPHSDRLPSACGASPISYQPRCSGSCIFAA